jgi:hypothetical protein
MSMESSLSEGDLHSLLGRALIDLEFRARLLDEGQQKAALEEVGITPTPDVLTALNSAIGALMELSSTFKAAQAAT